MSDDWGPLGDVELTRVTNLDEAQALMRWLGERRAGALSLDTETAGLGKFDPRQDWVRLVQVGDAMAAWTVDVEGWHALAVDVARICAPDAVYWNGRYDVECMNVWLGVDADAKRGWVRDTMLKSRLIDPLGRHDLKGVAAKRLGREAAALQGRLEEAMEEHGWTWATVPVDFPPYGLYGALDCVLTSRVDPTLVGDCPPELYDLECFFAAACRRIERRGLGVDLEYCRDQEVQHREEAQELGLKWAAAGVNLKSWQQVERAMRAQGWEPWKWTETGRVAQDKEALLGSPQPGPDFQRRKSCLKLANTYFRHLAETDGRVHPQINTLQAMTGRTSISNPSMQNLPRGPRVRDGLIAAEGKRLVAADFDHMELSIIAALFGDDSLKRAIREGRDVFAEMAQRGTGAVDPALRQLFKSTTYAVAYGAGPARIAAQAGVDLETAQRLIDSIDEEFPKFGRARRLLPDIARDRDRKRPWVRSRWTGRVWRTWEDKAYKLVNYIIQGTGADMFKQAVVDLDRAGLPMVIQVHDEVICEVDEADVEETRRLLEEVMPRRLDDVDLTVDASPGLVRWGDKERLKAEKHFDLDPDDDEEET